MEADAPAARTNQPAINHLAILVVYYLKDNDDIALLELHCSRVQRHTHVPYTIYATASRCSAEARAYISAQPNLELIDIPVTDFRSSAEHGYYLDALLTVALAGDASHVCTLDVDSFPLSDDWIDIVHASIDPVSGLTGVLRSENGDTDLAHPSCIMATRTFFERFQPTFAPFPPRTDAFRAFLRATGQSADTAIDLVARLWAADLNWGRLLRSNQENPHYLMAGIYSDAIFHLGGIGRGKVFRYDLKMSRVHRLSRPLEFLPAWRGKSDKGLRRLRSGAELRMANRNRDIYMLLREWLLSDSDDLFSYLRGERPSADNPWVRRVETMSPRAGRS